VNPALHWAPPPRVGGHWRFGGRLGLLGGAGDILGEVPFADPFLGGSLHGQASHFWDDGGAVTAALGWGYTGHTRCMEGCGYSMPREGFEDCTETAEEECPGPQRHSYNPFNAPSLHLRADLPAGHEGYAMMIALGAQPLIMNGRLEPIFTISAGLHHKDPGPQW
jgi:hypothetical protein